MPNSFVFRTLVVSSLIICVAAGAASPVTGQSSPSTQLVFPKDDPVISEKFRQHLSTLDAQESVKV